MCVCVRLVIVLGWRRRSFPVQQQPSADITSSPRLQTSQLPGPAYTLPRCVPAAPLAHLRYLCVFSNNELQLKQIQ